jgi:hypothetical protein
MFISHSISDKGDNSIKESCFHTHENFHENLQNVFKNLRYGQMNLKVIYTLQTVLKFYEKCQTKVIICNYVPCSLLPYIFILNKEG